MEIWIVTGIFIAVIVILLMGGNWMEAKWNRSHPPDDGDDGTSEVKFDEHDGAS